MEENPLSIDLKKLRKSLPPPPVAVAPLNITPPQRVILPTPTVAPVAMAPAPATRLLPPKPRLRWLPKWKIQLPLTHYLMFAGLALVVFGGGYYIYVHFWTQSPFGPTEATSSAQSVSTTSSGSAEMTEADIISQVGKLMLLPTDESPTLAKVSDPTVLQGQTFFKNAVTGDVVLMYAKSLRAILYDPAQDKIIEVGPITEATSTASSTK